MVHQNVDERALRVPVQKAGSCISVGEWRALLEEGLQFLQRGMIGVVECCNGAGSALGAEGKAFVLTSSNKRGGVGRGITSRARLCA